MRWIFYLFVGLILSGCVTGDYFLTLYINRSGTVDVVLNLENFSSNKQGALASKEHLEWMAKYKNAMLDEFRYLRLSGALRIRHHLVRDKPPYALIVQAQYPSIKTLAKVLELLTWTQGWKLIYADQGFEKQVKLSYKPDPSVKQISGNSENQQVQLRFIPTKASIVSHKGFELRSNTAVLNLNKETFFSPKEKSELLLSWKSP